MYAYANYLAYTEKNHKEALTWALKAAEAGHLWTMRGQFNDWKKTRSRNISGMICWGFAIYWGMAANRTRQREKRYWREAQNPLIKIMGWE